MLCGCLESKAEFDALNLGKVNALYENGALKIVPNHHCDGECQKQSNSSLRDDSHESQKQFNSSLRESRSDSWQSTENQKDSAPFALFFFTTSCGVCKAQIPILQEIASENGGARIYAILGNVPNEQKAREYASANAMSLPLFYEGEAKRFFSQIVGGVKGIPAIVVFDKEGRVKERFIGLTPKSIISGALSF